METIINHCPVFLASSEFVFFFKTITLKVAICCRYLTTLQLVQFVTFFVHACFPLFFDCNFPVVFRQIAVLNEEDFFLFLI